MSWDEIIKGTNGSDIINGGSGDDFIQGRAGGDFLDGGNGNDQIQGNEGDDYIRGGAGNDFIHGGTGTDTAIYSGSIKDYAYNRNGEEFFLSHVGGSMVDGYDRLISIERLVFADAVIDLTHNNAPIAFDDIASTNEDSSVSGNVLTNDFDWEGNSLTATPGTFNGVFGTLVLNSNGSYTYTPYASNQSLAQGQSVQESFSYTVSDGSLSDSGTLTVTIAGVNDAPVANPDVASTGENSAVTIDVLANDTDVDNGAVLTVTAASAPAGQGSASIVANQVVFDPGTDFNYLDTGETANVVVSYTIADEHGATSSSTVTITVSGANDAPVAVDDTNSTDENSPVSGNVLANDTDVDGEPLTVTTPGTYNGFWGTLVLAANGSYTYTPNAIAALLNNGQSAIDVFAYTASDGTASDGATLTITVNCLSGVPNAVDDNATTTENASVSGNVLTNDTDAENDPLTVSDPGTYAGTYGTLTLAADGSYTYAPNAAANGLAAGETGQDVFTYTATDGGASDSATLTVTVNGANDAPTITGGDFDGTVTELPDGDPDEGGIDHSDSGVVTFNDVDLTDTHTASVAPQGGGYYGMFTLDPVDQSGDNVGWDFTVSDAALENLSEDQEVTQVYTITINDGHGGTVTQDVTITLNGTGVGTGPQTVWYIDNSAVTSTNVGTSANPFTSIAAFNAAQGTLGGPQVGHTVHLLAGTGTGIYAEADGINLLSGQTLIGEPTGAVRPTIEAAAGDGINVAQNNDISGIDIGNTSGADIADSGGSVGTLTISDVGTSGTGQIIDVDQGGTLDVTLNGAESLASSGGAVDLAGVGGSFTVTGATTITGVHSGGGIDITGSSVAASFAGGGNVATLNTAAVNYVGNSGTLALDGGFDILTTSGAGLNASGGGTVTVTGSDNSIASTTGTALSVSGTEIGLAGLTFESISSNGAASGIVLANTGTTAGVHGGLTVTGDGGSANNGSGGTIGGSTGAGISLTNTRDTSLDQINVENGLDDGIRGNNVTNFTLTNATVTNNGNGLQESGADFTNLLGAGTFTDVTFSNNESSQVSIVNSSGTSNLAFTEVTMSSTGLAAAPNGLHGLNVVTQGTATADLLVADSAFDNLFSNSVNAFNTGSGTLEVEITATDFTNVGASAINIAQSGSGTVRFDIHDNDTFLRGTNSGISHSININQTSTVPAGAVMEGAISNNTIGDNSSSTSATNGGDGIRIFSVGAGTTTVLIDDNDIRGVGGNGINVQMSGSANSAHTLNATILDNNVVLTDINSLDAIRVVAGASTGNAGTLRLDMHDNDASSANANDFTVRQRFATTVELLDYTGGPTDTAAVQSYFDNDRANDPLGAGNDWLITTQLPGGGFLGTASVPQPILPIIGDLPML
jgi:VCBS repeat-containing protein